jgi:hypothetical protein
MRELECFCLAASDDFSEEYLHLTNLNEYVYNWRQRVPVDDRKEVVTISELLAIEPSKNEELNFFMSWGKNFRSSLRWAILPNYHSPAQSAPPDHVLSLALHMDISRLKLIELTCLSWSDECFYIHQKPK